MSCTISTPWDRNAAAVRTAMSIGKLADADLLADKALAEASGLPESDMRIISLVILKASIASLDGRHADAVKFYNRAITLRIDASEEMTPQVAPILLAMARVELSRKRPHAAIERLDQLLDIDEKHGPLASHLVGQAYGEKGAALAQLERWRDAAGEYGDAAGILRDTGPVAVYHRYQRANVKLLRQLGLIAKAETIEASFRPPEGNYLWNVLLKDQRPHFSDIRYVSRWRRNQMPLRVFIPPPPGDQFDDAEALVQTITSAVRAWEGTVEPGIPSFVFVKDKLGADIPFLWVPRHDLLSTLAVTQREFSPTGGSFSVRYVSVAVSALLAVGDQEESLATVVTHEMGHALGLFGHSPSPVDTMYPSAHMINLQPSDTDLETIRQLYGLEPATQVKCPPHVQDCAKFL